MTNPSIFNPAVIADQIPEMEFRPLGEFNDGGVGVFWSTAGGPSPWEMHPDCEELLHVIEGEIDVEILPIEGPSKTHTVEAGSYLIVPRGMWHRQYMKQKTKELYLTPGRTLHSEAEEPRVGT